MVIAGACPVHSSVHRGLICIKLEACRQQQDNVKCPTPVYSRAQMMAFLLSALWQSAYSCSMLMREYLHLAVRLCRQQQSADEELPKSGSHYLQAAAAERTWPRASHWSGATDSGQVSI